MKSLLMICVFFCLLGSTAQADELAQIGDKNLVHILNNTEIVAEQKKPPVSVKVIRIQDSGECDGRPQTCPKQIFYIAVSTFDEAPDEKVYVLPKSYGWEFIGWKTVPKEEGPNHHVVLEVKEKVISPTPDKAWWSERYYEIGVNPWNGYMKAVQYQKSTH